MADFSWKPNDQDQYVSGNWDVAANWRNDIPADPATGLQPVLVPGSGDVAVIGGLGLGEFTVTHGAGSSTVASLGVDGSATLAVTGGTLTVSSIAGGDGTMLVNGGMLGAGELSTRGTVSVSVGTLAVAGIALVAGTLTQSGGSVSLGNFQEDDGGIHYDNATIDLSGGKTTIDQGGSLNGSLIQTGGELTLLTALSVLEIGGAGTVSLGGLIDGLGVLKVDASESVVLGPGLSLGVPFTDASQNGLPLGTITLAADLGITTAFNVDYAPLNLGTHVLALSNAALGVAVQGSGGEVLNQGQLNFGGTLNAGALLLNTTSGTLYLGGTLGAGATIRNAGTALIQGTPFAFADAGGGAAPGTLGNAAMAELDISSSVQGSNGVIVNSGLLVWTMLAGTSQELDAALTGSGVLQIAQGTLILTKVPTYAGSFTGTGTLTLGSAAVTSSATLAPAGAAPVVLGTAKTVLTNEVLTIAAAVVGQGNFSSGASSTITLNAPLTLNANGGTVSLDGTLNGSNTLIAAGGFQSDALTIVGGATLLNQGTGSLTGLGTGAGGTPGITLSGTGGSGTISNAAGAILTIYPAGISDPLGTGAVINNGSIVASYGTIQAAIKNTGTIRADGGTFSVQGNYSSLGGDIIGSGIVDFTANATLNPGGGGTLSKLEVAQVLLEAGRTLTLGNSLANGIGAAVQNYTQYSNPLFGNAVLNLGTNSFEVLNQATLSGTITGVSPASGGNPALIVDGSLTQSGPLTVAGSAALFVPSGSALQSNVTIGDGTGMAVLGMQSTSSLLHVAGGVTITEVGTASLNAYLSIQQGSPVVFNGTLSYLTVLAPNSKLILNGSGGSIFMYGNATLELGQQAKAGSVLTVGRDQVIQVDSPATFGGTIDLGLSSHGTIDLKGIAPSGVSFSPSPGDGASGEVGLTNSANTTILTGSDAAPTIQSDGNGGTLIISAATPSNTATVADASGATHTLNFAYASTAAEAETLFAGLSPQNTDFDDGGGQIAMSSSQTGFVEDSGLPTTVTGGGAANETIVAGEGDFDFAAGAGGSGSVVAGAGADSIALLGDTGNWACSVEGGAASVVAAAGNDTIATDGGANFIFLGAGMSFCTSAGSDTILGGAGAATVSAAGGASDLVFSLGAALQFIAGTGANTVAGGAFANTLLGGAGNSLFFTDGATTYTGGTGIDTLVGLDGSLSVQGGAGGGVYFGGTAGDNVITAGAGNTTAFGGGAGDVLTATGSASDLFAGGVGAETLNGAGSTGANTFFAGFGPETLWGGAGNTALVAGAGNDLLAGGGGLTLFLFVNGRAIGGGDTITGFDPTHDFVKLAGYATPEADVVANAVTTNGSAVITLTDGTNVTFAGVPTLTLSSFN